MPKRRTVSMGGRQAGAARSLALAGALLLASSMALAVTPSPAALEKVGALPATRMGVDRAGNLWAWDKHADSVAVVTPDGRLLAPWKAPGAQAVDFDAEWGLAGLYKLGHELRWSRRGMPDAVLPLPAQALDLCWIGPATVAITPLASDRRVEVWNLREAVRARSFGPEPTIGKGPGAVPLRAVLLRFDPARQRLYTLDSATGHLQVFDPAGKLLWGAAFANPHRGEIEAWLRDVDARERRAGTSQRPIFLDLYPGLDGQGRFWTVQAVSGAAKTAELAGAVENGRSRRSLPHIACPSRTFVFWGNHLVFYTDTANPREVCNSIERFEP
jgi:hypothetical protein